MEKETKKEGFWKKHSHKKGFAILALIVFAPIGIWLIFKHKHFKSKTRYIISAVALAWFSFIIIDGQPTEEEIQAEEAAKAEREAEAEEKKIAKEEEKAEKEAAKKEKKKAEEEAKEKEEQDKEAKELAEKEAKEQEEADKKAAKEAEKKQVEKEKKEKEENTKKAEEEWEDYRKDLLDHYGDVEILDIRTDEHFLVFYAIVPNEFKLSTEEEKQYYVEEIGPWLENDINAHFGESAHVYFHYEDGNSMADRKAFGGWKIK